jgi:catechol 2,3-dioxygenase-like lactoylglutathione lyase family enzyme
MRQLSMVTLFVHDHDEALACYTSKLGFKVKEDAMLGNERWITIAFPGELGASINLQLAATPEQRALVGRQGGGQPLFGITTDDCLGDYDHMSRLGVQFLGEPVVRPYGTGVSLRDVYSNILYLNEEPKRAS